MKLYVVGLMCIFAAGLVLGARLLWVVSSLRSRAASVRDAQLLAADALRGKLPSIPDIDLAGQVDLHFDLMWAAAHRKARILRMLSTQAVLWAGILFAWGSARIVLFHFEEFHGVVPPATIDRQALSFLCVRVALGLVTGSLLLLSAECLGNLIDRRLTEWKFAYRRIAQASPDSQ